MITVKEFCRLFTDEALQSIILWDVNEIEDSPVVFEGHADDAANSKYAECFVQSIDTMYDDSTTLTINICTED